VKALFNVVLVGKLVGKVGHSLSEFTPMNIQVLQSNLISIIYGLQQKIIPLWSLIFFKNLRHL